MIKIYCDEGTSLVNVKEIIALIKELEIPMPIFLTNAEKITNKNDLKDSQLLIMPGGRDIPYQKKLKNKGNRIIKKFVENGGSYLGICAGAYYASSCVEFDKNGSNEVLEKRDLKFFKGKCIGPALKTKFEYSSEKFSSEQSIITKSGLIKMHLNGGGFFAKAHLKKCRVMGRFEDNKAAILKIKDKKGKVILTSLHIERDIEENKEERRAFNLEIFKYLLNN